jgi:hypothetical protein
VRAGAAGAGAVGLSEAPSKEAVFAVHGESSGVMPDEIFDVQELE